MGTLGLYSLSEQTSYRKISWSLEAMRFGFRLFRLLWNLTGNSAVVLPRCRERYDPYNIQSRSFETPRDLAVRRLTAQWIETLVSIKKCWSMFGIFLYCWNHENCHPHLVKSFFSRYVLTNTDFLFFFNDLQFCTCRHVRAKCWQFYLSFAMLNLSKEAKICIYVFLSFLPTEMATVS